MSDSPKKSANGPASVQALMQNHDAGFARILKHARLLNRLDATLNSVLEPALSAHCQVAEFRDHCLVLVCSNASFATRIRMISKQLLDSFRDEGETAIERIEIRIAPVNRPQPDARTKRTLSPAALEALGRFASDSGDADIQAIFDRINARRNDG
jgi:hypothetical protein